MAASVTGIHNHARGEHRAPALFRRTWRPQAGMYGRFSHVLLLGDGSARLGFGADTHDMQAPAAGFLPATSGAVVELSAGTEGYVVGASEELMIDAIGHWVESVQLRILAERPAVIGTLARPEFAEIVALARGFIDELNRPERGSWMALAAYMRLILIFLRRAGESGKPDAPGQGEVGSILQRFRLLVDLHFRDHWPVRAYVRELGLPYERLHGLCRRALGRTPGQLVHERMLREACLLLERSASSIQQVAESLGYGDPTYFSHFFKRKTGHSPAGYRRLLRERARGGRHPDLFSGFSDWP